MFRVVFNRRIGNKNAVATKSAVVFGMILELFLISRKTRADCRTCCIRRVKTHQNNKTEKRRHREYFPPYSFRAFSFHRNAKTIARRAKLLTTLSHTYPSIRIVHTYTHNIHSTHTQTRTKRKLCLNSLFARLVLVLWVFISFVPYSI